MESLDKTREFQRGEEVIAKTGNIHYNYDTMGRIKERIMPDGIVTRYTADPLGRLTGLIHQKEGKVSDQFQYVYDPVGNIIEIDKNRAGAETDSGSFHYSYDPLGVKRHALAGTDSTLFYYCFPDKTASSFLNSKLFPVLTTYCQK